jgi:CRP-like cAMP-binding protein
LDAEQTKPNSSIPTSPSLQNIQSQMDSLYGITVTSLNITSHTTPSLQLSPYGSFIKFQKLLNVGSAMKALYHVQRCSLLWKLVQKASVREYILNAQTWNAEDIGKIASLRENNSNNSNGSGFDSLSNDPLPGEFLVCFLLVVIIIFESFFQLGTKHATKFDKGQAATSGRSNITINVDGLDERQWKLILTNAKVVTCPKDYVVFQEGSENEYLFRVKNGHFRVERRREDKRVLLATLGSNSVFGEMSFLDGNRTSASVISDEEGSQLWKLEIAFVKRLFSSDSDLFRVFYQYLATILAKRLKNHVFFFCCSWLILLTFFFFVVNFVSFCLLTFYFDLVS